MLSSEGIIGYIDHTMKKWVYSIDYSGESWLEHYLEQEEVIESRKQEKLEQEKLERELIMRSVELLREAINSGDRTKTDEMISSLRQDTVRKNKVDALLTQEDWNKLFLIYFPPKYNIDTIVTVVGEDNSTQVENVTYNKENKYHMYRLKNYPDRVFREEHLILYETNSEISNSRDLQEQ